MRAPYSAMCDLLFNADSFQIQKFPGVLQPVAEWKTSVFGNWVGGEVHCLTDRLVFSLNAKERQYQRETADIVIPYGQVTDVRPGRLLIFARTVDVQTTVGPLRLRPKNGEGERLAEEITARLAP